MEETIVSVVDWVPPERGAVWAPECNMVFVSKALCSEERDRAILALTGEWQRSVLRLVV